MEGFFTESAGFLIQRITRQLVVSFKILPSVASVDGGPKAYYDIRSDVTDNINLCNLMLFLFAKGLRKKKAGQWRGCLIGCLNSYEVAVGILTS